MTTELLGLRSSGVGDQERAVVGDKELAELKGRGGIVVLGVVGDERLGDGLADGVHLRSGTTTRNTQADVDSAVRRFQGATFQQGKKSQSTCSGLDEGASCASRAGRDAATSIALQHAGVLPSFFRDDNTSLCPPRVE